jgi:hypothetical protein
MSWQSDIEIAPKEFSIDSFILAHFVDERGKIKIDTIYPSEEGWYYLLDSDDDEHKCLQVNYWMLIEYPSE